MEEVGGGEGGGDGCEVAKRFGVGCGQREQGKMEQKGALRPEKGEGAACTPGLEGRKAPR